MQSKINEINILSLLKNTEAILEGHFILSSGLHTSQYFQCAKLLQNPENAEIIAKELVLQIDFKVDTVVGPAIGGIIIGYEVARSLKKRFLFTERKDGIVELRRGFRIQKGEQVLIVEDVMTTAKSAIEAKEAIIKQGGIVAGYACIVDRTCGKTGLNIKSLMQMNPMVYQPESCFLCKEGIPVIKPGSRI